MKRGISLSKLSKGFCPYHVPQLWLSPTFQLSGLPQLASSGEPSR